MSNIFSRNRLPISANDPPRLLGFIDCQSEVIASQIVIHGWVFCQDHPIVAVLFFVDGEAHLARCGSERPDVAAVYGETLNIRYSGFQVDVDLRLKEGSDVIFRAAAVTSDGRTEVFTETTVRSRSQARIHFHPIARAVTTDEHFLAVSGVALMEHHVSSIQIHLNSRPIALARLNAFPTPENSWSKMPMSAMSAFNSMIDIRDCEPGANQVLTAIATCIDGKISDIAELEFVVREPFGLRNVSDLISRPAIEQSSRTFEGSGSLRLLVVTHHLGIGGGQFYLQELIRQLVALIDVELMVVSEDDGLLRSELEGLGAKVVVVGNCPLGDAFAYESFVQQIIRLSEEFCPEFVLANTTGTIFGLDIALRLGIPSIIAIHESYTFDEWFVAARGNFATHPYVRQRYRNVLEECPAVVFESEATQKMYIDVVAESSSVLIRYGINTQELNEYSAVADRRGIRASLGIDANALVFLCVGTFEPRKSQAMLASAFARASRDHSEAILIMVGAQDNAYSVAVSQLIADLKAENMIRVIPVVRDLRPWYAVADFLISASDVESMPRSMMEGMAFGLPVVAANAPGVNELVEDGSTGWLCSTRDLLDLAETIGKALNVTASRRQEMSKAAVQKVIRDHQSFGYGREFEKLISSLLPGRVKDLK